MSDNQETRNSVVLKSFVTYCKANPSQRFWQALRNWSAKNFILSANSISFTRFEEKVIYEDIEDTFNWEGRYRNELPR